MKNIRSAVMRSLRFTDDELPTSDLSTTINTINVQKQTPTWLYWPRVKYENWNSSYSIFDLFRGSDSPGSFTFSSSDPTLATVDNNGIYSTSNKSGTVTITATQAETEQYTSLTRSFDLIM
jgi:hypothetical protein